MDNFTLYFINKLVSLISSQFLVFYSFIMSVLVLFSQFYIYWLVQERQKLLQIKEEVFNLRQDFIDIQKSSLVSESKPLVFNGGDESISYFFIGSGIIFVSVLIVAGLIFMYFPMSSDSNTLLDAGASISQAISNQTSESVIASSEVLASGIDENLVCILKISEQLSEVNQKLINIEHNLCGSNIVGVSADLYNAGASSGFINFIN